MIIGFYSSNPAMTFTTGPSAERPIRDAVQDLMECGVQRIHLLLAAPTSLTIRMGMAYERRLMPDLWVYQYERSDDPP